MGNNKGPVSFNFDSTLSIASIQEYAKMLVDKGIEVWIVTSRYDSPDKYTPVQIRSYGHSPGDKLQKAWDELFVVADRLGILREHIVFTNMENKVTYFKDHPEFIWHLDDLFEEVNLINESTEVIGVCWIGNKTWKEDCAKMLFD